MSSLPQQINKVLRANLQIHVRVDGDEVAFVLHAPLESDHARLAYEALKEGRWVELPDAEEILSLAFVLACCVLCVCRTYDRSRHGRLLI